MELRRYFARPPVSRLPRPIEATEPAPALDFVLVPATPPEPPRLKQAAVHFPYHQAHQRRPSARRTPRRRFALVLALLANGVALCLLGWVLHNGPAEPKSSENPLRTAQSSSKVKPTSAPAPEVPPPLPPMPIVAPKLEEKKPVSPPPTLPSEPLIVIPAPPIVQAPAPEKPPEPTAPKLDKAPVLVWLPYRVFAPKHGETPMLYNWKMLKWASAMAVAVTVTPASFAQEKKDEILDAIKALEKKVGDGFTRVQQDMDTLKPIVLGNSARIDALEKKLADLRAEFDTLKGRNISLYESEKATLDKMKDRLEQVEKSLNGGKVTVKSPASTGRVVLKNMYPERLSFVLNGQTYDVPAYSDFVLDNQRLGPLTYEVWSPTYGRRAANTVMLNPDRPFTLLATLP
jgi:hypothetical protein